MVLQCDSFSEPVVVLQQFKQNGDPLSLTASLRSLKPKYIIMYNVDVTAIRQIEVNWAFIPSTIIEDDESWQIVLRVYHPVFLGMSCNK